MNSGEVPESVVSESVFNDHHHHHHHQHLPSATFESDTSDDDDDDKEVEESCIQRGLSIFSRSNHIKSLGLHLEEEEKEEEEEEEERGGKDKTELELKSGALTNEKCGGLISDQYRPSSSGVELDVDSSRKGAVVMKPPDKDSEESIELNKSWNDFQTEFDNSLKMSEDKMASGLLQNQQETSKEHQDMLMEMIMSLHSSNSTEQQSGGNDVIHTGSPVLLLKPSQSSPTRPRRQVLSLNTLETIPESEIDRALEIVESTSYEKLQSNDSGTFSLTDDDPLSPSSPQTCLKWGMRKDLPSNRDNELMEQLVQLSHTQANGHVGFGDSSTTNTVSSDGSSIIPEITSPQRIVPETEKPAVFLDVRKSAENSSVNGHNQRDDSDLDEEEEDSYGWALQRRKIKSGLEGSTSSASSLSPLPSITTVPPLHNLHRVHRAHLHTSTSEEEENKLEASPQKEKASSHVMLSQEGDRADVEEKEHDRGGRNNPPDVVMTQRQRSSDSLTLSSSYSDDDLLSPGCSGDQRDLKKDATSTSRGKKSKKQSKKSKKSKKSEKTQSSQSSGRFPSSQRRRAYVLQRIRNDSLNTSSDEEHSLTLSSDAAVSNSALPEMPTKETVFDAEKVKEHIHERVLSKKPPAQFDTPATDPIFHEDVSFSKQLSDHLGASSSTSPSGVLVLPVMQYGLTTLPCAWSELEVDSLALLHSLVMTWLTYRAANDCSNSTKTQYDDKENGMDTVQVPFRITGLQQMVLDGNSCILIAIQEESIDCSEDDDSRPISESVINEFLYSVSLERVLQPLLNDGSISSRSSLSALRPVLSKPLSLLFTYQEDTSPLTTPISFYWHSTYHLSCLPSAEALKSQNELTTTMCVLNYTSLSNPFLVFSVFQQILTNGLDIAGVRLLYGELDTSISSMESSLSSTSNCDASKDSVALVLALRGPNAVYHWSDRVGPSDSALAKITDPSSLTALFGSQLISTIRTPYRSMAALAKWFGGRACLKTATIFGISDSQTKLERRKRQRVRFSESESEDGIFSLPIVDTAVFPPLILNRPRLIAHAYTKSILVVSPSVPPSCYSTVFISCNKLGFDIYGVKRIRLNTKRAQILEIPGDISSSFTPSSTPPSPALDSSYTNPLLSAGTTLYSFPSPPLPSVIFIIGRENSSVHCTTLKRLIVTNLKSLVESNDQVEVRRDLLDYPSSVIHLASHTEEKLKVIGNFACPIPAGNIQSRVNVEEDNENVKTEELCFVAVSNEGSLPVSVSFLNLIFNISQESHTSDLGKKLCTLTSSWSTAAEQDIDVFGGFEMVGMKFIPQITRFHAKKLCPYSVSDPLYSQAVQLLSDRPVTLFVFRGICCNRRIQHYAKLYQKPNTMVSLEKRLQLIISSNSTEALHLSNLFLSGKDIFSDTGRRVLSLYLPNAWICESDILSSSLKPRDNIFSVLQLPMTQMRQSVKILDKLSRSGFAFVGITTVELNTENKNVVGNSGTQTNVTDVGEPGIVVCVEKINSVWNLEHVVVPFIKERSTGGQMLKYSQNFNSAIFDVKSFFPHGLYLQEEENSIAKDYDIKRISMDNFDHILLPEACRKRLKSSSSMNYVSPLLERTIIFLPPTLLFPEGVKVPRFIHVLEVLNRIKFELCGMKMVLLSEDSVREIKIMLSLDIEIKPFPCLVLVLERDNAASCFHMIVRSAITSLLPRIDDVARLLSEIIAPSRKEKANELLSYFHVDLL